jgi:hypothetical protein
LLRAQYSDVAVLSFLEIPETKKVEVIAIVGGPGSLTEPAAPDAPQEIGAPYAD